MTGGVHDQASLVVHVRAPKIHVCSWVAVCSRLAGITPGRRERLCPITDVRTDEVLCMRIM